MKRRINVHDAIRRVKQLIRGKPQILDLAAAQQEEPKPRKRTQQIDKQQGILRRLNPELKIPPVLSQTVHEAGIANAKGLKLWFVNGRPVTPLPDTDRDNQGAFRARDAG